MRSSGLPTSRTPERAAWNGELGAGLVDVDVARWGPRARRFTWWNYGIGYSRNLGMRLDVIAADPALADTVDTTWIDHVERDTDRPSDHAALIADFDLAPLAAARATTTTPVRRVALVGEEGIPITGRDQSCRGESTMKFWMLLLGVKRIRASESDQGGIRVCRLCGLNGSTE